MTVLECFGCAFIAFGPALAMFTFTIAKDPIRIIILIASAFFWLLSLLLSSLLWFVVIPLKSVLAFGMVFSVLFQEFFRFLIYKLLRKAEGGLKKVTDANTGITNNRHTLAYVAGLGFGMMSGAFSTVNVLADSLGPGTVGIHGDSDLFFVTSAAMTLCFVLLHTFWGVIFFHSLDTHHYLLIAYVVVSHIVVSGLTPFNQKQMYYAAIIPAYIVLIVTGGVAFRVAGGNLERLLAFFVCKPKTVEVTVE